MDFLPGKTFNRDAQTQALLDDIEFVVIVFHMEVPLANDYHENTNKYIDNCIAFEIFLSNQEHYI